MASLFDLPFEEPEADAAPEPRRPRQQGQWSSPQPPPAHDSQPAQPPVRALAARRVLSVSAFSAAIREILENAFPEVWIEGELSNCKRWQTGHLYFTLKDEHAQVKAVMFRSACLRLRFAPQDGLRVILRGRLTVYDPKGEYQLVAEHLEPQGHGALQVAFEQLKQALFAEGLFDPARKRPLPLLPRRIGLVTSLDGAALRDIVRVLFRRYPNAQLVIAPTRVQGEGAGREVARALRWVGRLDRIDVVIVGRGGGSLEDLWAFNEEVVARAIAACPVAVISAVGHETDVTIADFVADVRAPTPSAAAEIVVRRKDEFCAQIDRLHERLHATARQAVQARQTRLRLIEGRPGFAGARGRIALRARHVAESTAALARHASWLLARHSRRHEQLRRLLDTRDPRHRLASVRTVLVQRRAQLEAAVAGSRHRADARLRSSVGRLESLSPLAVLGRGYAVCWDADRTRVIRNAASVEAGEKVRVTLAEGELRCRVEA